MGKPLLIVSPPSTDIIIGPGGRHYARPGGPALYAGAAAAVLGYSAVAVGSWGWANACSVEAERIVGVERLSAPAPSRGAVFLIDYTSGPDRRVEALAKPPATPMGEALRAVGLVRPSAAIVSPLYGDLHPGLPVLLRGRTPLLGLDVQGFARAGILEALPRGSADIVHAAAGEAPPDTLSAVGGLAVVTSGYGPAWALEGGGKRLLFERPPGPKLEDPTGAGDAFLAMLVALIAEGLGLEEAALEASRLVPRALRLASEAVEGVTCEM